MFINIDKYKDGDTIGSIKSALIAEQLKQAKDHDNYIAQLRELEGEYILCKHNLTNGFVCLLTENWWSEPQKVIYIPNMRESIESIDPLFYKTDHRFSVDCISVITKEEYDQVVTLMNTIRQMEKTQLALLWSRK